MGIKQLRARIMVIDLKLKNFEIESQTNDSIKKDLINEREKMADDLFTFCENNNIDIKKVFC